MSDHVNLLSTDAMFAKVLAKLEQQESTLVEIRTLCENQGARIATLERDALSMRSKVSGAVIVLSFVVGTVGWAVQQGFQHLFSRS